MGIEVAERIAASVDRRPPVNGIRIVGVDGRSGSGKSFLASQLSALMAAPIVEIDDFVSWDCFAGWWPRFDEQVLSPLLAGRDAIFQARDWTDWYGSSLGEWKTQRWSPTVILEGVTCTRRETIGRITYAIWVEASAQIRLARGLARDTDFPGKEDLWRQWMREEDEFFAADRTRERADVIVDTSADGVYAPR
jgi:uridine kinase